MRYRSSGVVDVAAHRRQSCERGIMNGARRLERGKLCHEDEGYREQDCAQTLTRAGNHA
jgi:hypothetical protein